MTDIVVTPANVVISVDAVINWGWAGVAINAGQALYLDSVDGKLKLADANAATPEIAAVVGVALNGGGIGQTISYLSSGEFNPGATLVKGTTYILSQNPGGIAPAADLTTGWRLSYIGYATTTALMRLNLKSTAVQL